MKETLRLEDETEAYLFKSLRDIKVNDAGEVFIQGDDQLLVFDAQGKFKRNLLKKGEGPGEFKYGGEFNLIGTKRILSDFMPLKIMFFDAADKLVREIKPTGFKPFATYFLTLGDVHYVTEDDMDFQKVKTGVTMRQHQLLTVDGQGKAQKTPLTFSTREVVVVIRDKERSVMMMNNITRLLTACDGQKYLYVVDGDRYQVSQIDLPAQKVVREFKMDYASVPFVPQPERDDRRKQMDEMAGQKTFCDIWALRCLGRDLLVVTSRIDPKKGVRVDRWDGEGRMTDSVWLKLPSLKRPDDLENRPMFFWGDDFWTAYVDEDDNPMVVKYRLDWKKP